MSPSEYCTQELRCSDTVTASTVNCPTVGGRDCGTIALLGGVWIYFISDIDARVTASLCGGLNLSYFYTIIEVYQDSVEGVCVGSNDDHSSCTSYQSFIKFDAVEREKYIVLVTGYDGSEGTFTLLVECYQPSLDSLP